MTINFNPNLPPNDCLSTWQIEAIADARNAQTRELAKKAYEVGGVPPSIAEVASKHLSTFQDGVEALEHIQDARTWWGIKRREERNNASS